MEDEELKGTTIDRLNEALVHINVNNTISGFDDVFIYVVTKIHSRQEAEDKAKYDFLKRQRSGKIPKNSIITSIEVEDENFGGGNIPYRVI